MTIEEMSHFDKDKRRRQIIVKDTIFVFMAYCITQFAALIAHIFKFSSISYKEILFVTSFTLGFTVCFLILIRLKKTITTGFANFIILGQFGVWLVMYTVWFFTLREIRVMALFFALMALIFLISNSRFIQSLSIAIGAAIIQIVGSYYAIFHLGQPGSFGQEVFFAGCFLPSAVFIAFLSEHYARQRAEIKKAKRIAEQNHDALLDEIHKTNRINIDLEKAEAKYRSIFDNAVEGIFLIVPTEDRFISVNSSLAKMAGYNSPEEMISSITDIPGQLFADPDDHKTIADILKINNEIVGFETEFYRKDSTVFFGSFSARKVFDSDSMFMHYEGTLIDFTDRIKREKAEREREAAEASNRTKSEFLTNMSHEIRTPLNGIIGMTEIAMDTNLDNNQQEIVNVINHESEILLNLINDILDFSKIEAKHYELEAINFDIRVLIEDLAQSFSMRSEKKGLEIVTFLSPDVPSRIVGDPGRLRQIIANLVGNALKFTDKGEVFIKVEMVEDLGESVVLKFSVRDTGIGISEEHQHKVFDLFTQADGTTTRRYGGTGLGLAISKSIVEMMEGDIGVKSTMGKGSTFFFTAIFTKTKDQKSFSVSEDVDLEGLRVLVVDDNETNRLILMDFLKRWGCNPVDSTGGEKVISKLRAADGADEPFELILMDFFMPEMDGFELSRRIRAIDSLKKTPIIMLTSRGNVGEARVSMDIGIQGYLLKPVRRDTLKKAIMSVMSLMKKKEFENLERLVTRHTIDEDFRKDIQLLLVEDYPTNQQVATRHLSKAGYQVDVAENGQQAVSAYKRKHYDLILMDIQMPVKDGYDATNEIRQWEDTLYREGFTVEISRIPIIALTAHATIGYRQRCIEAGMDDYLSKPLRREELVDMVDKWVGQKISTEEEIQGINQTAEVPEDDTAGNTGCPIDLDRAMNEFDSDMGFIRELVGGFLKNMKKQLEIIRTGIQKGDAEAARREAHSIKGGSLNIYADDLSRVALEMENLGKTGDVGDGMEILLRLENEFKRLDEYYNG